jgi:flagellar biogenesis protein FliO
MNQLLPDGFAEKAGRAWSILTSRFSAVGRGMFQRRERHLRLCETLSLGEKRFLAVVSFKEEEFLVGGTNHSIALLTKLPANAEDEFKRNS